jgi:hypothetical protein
MLKELILGWTPNHMQGNRPLVRFASLKGKNPVQILYYVNQYMLRLIIMLACNRDFCQETGSSLTSGLKGNRFRVPILHR